MDEISFHESATINGTIEVKVINEANDGHGWALWFDTDPLDDQSPSFTISGDQLADILDRWNLSLDISRIKHIRAVD